ncbi:hypothetical protein DRE_00492 [Drechslerella stenobrocha 248]|uniref:SH3 domain-containing protein n=1 Tax=Drechslerella stenobrocha 248 TaxID=1043628 RepID=W7HVI6_9PEZI|nr:hypothetical protein DRE_00492 [Drechslerella stenobrocha 248]
MANPDRFYMSSPRFYVDKQRAVDDMSDYHYHRGHSGRHSIADLSLASYRTPRGPQQSGRDSYSRSNSRYDRSRYHSTSRSRSRSRSSSSSRADTFSHSRSRRSKSRSRRLYSDHKGHRRHRSHSSSSSSDSLSSFSTVALAPPPQFVTPIYEFHKGEKGDLALKIGDVIEVRRYVDENWYKGVNLSTKKRGIFPVAYVKEAEVSSTQVVEPLSGRQQRTDQLTGKETLVIGMPTETERRGSFFYPTDTVIVRDRGNRVTNTGFQEIDQDVILIRPRDTINNEPARIVQPTVERDIVEVDHGSHHHHHHQIEEDITIVKPRRAIGSPAADGGNGVVIPIRRKEISLSEIPKYANTAPDVDIERIRVKSNGQHGSADRRILTGRSNRTVVDAPTVVERPREIEEMESTISRRSRPRAGSVKQDRLERPSSHSPVRSRREYKMLPPPQTITYNEHGVPVFVNTKTFAPAPAMVAPPRPYYSHRVLEPAPVPVLPAHRSHRAYQY